MDTGGGTRQTRQTLGTLGADTGRDTRDSREFLGTLGATLGILVRH